MGNALDELNGSPPGEPDAALKRTVQRADVTEATGAAPEGSLPRTKTMTTEQPKQGIRARLGSLVRRSDSASVPPALVPLDSPDPWDEFSRELNRSRRYERTFVVIRIPCRQAAYEEMLQVGAFLRSVDRAWIADASVYVLLPESDRPMGDAFLSRVRRLAPEVLPDEGVRLAAFPIDGSTSGALLAKLRGQPLPGTPRDVATLRAPHLREIELRPQRPTGEST